MKSRLAWLGEYGHAALVRHGLRGIEKECLRIDSDGRLSRKPHPQALGAALTHPHITTDYSEALLEFVTPPCATNWETLQFLCDIHCFVAQNLDDELLWAQSMPCVVGPDEDVPIAYYGESNLGRMKTIYRRGLGHRYGRAMQAIAGVHFNYSLPVGFWAAYQDYEESRQDESAFISGQYLRMARNYRRNAWALIYLFGASPAVCKSFPLRAGHGLEELDPHTWYLPYGTSLRMSDIGYRNKSQARLQISLNSLAEYVGGLTTAVTSSSPEYERIGVNVDGEYRQLNANMLQIENEYYSSVRPKQVPLANEKPTHALKRRGVRYVELRSLDINMFEPTGISATQCRFLETLMAFCLLQDSPVIDDVDRREIDTNLDAVCYRGREPGLLLQRAGTPISLQQWAGELCDAMAPLADMLDTGHSEQPYRAALQEQVAAVNDPGQTCSARVLADMRKYDEGYFHYARRMSLKHQQYFLELPRDNERLRELDRIVDKSIADQRATEAADTLSFDEFLEQYFAQKL